jgi:excisionase family DNA binding protein
MNTKENQKERIILSSFTLEELTNEINNIISKQISEFKNTVNQKNNEEYLTSNEVKKLLGVSLPTLLDWTKREIIIGYKINTRVRYKKSEIDNYFNKINKTK